MAAIQDGFNVQVNALAGTGKTTTASLIAHQRRDLRILVLTYNRNLADESNRVFEKHGLVNIRCRTYHEQIGLVATSAASKRVVCKTDRDVLAVLERWSRKPPSPIHDYDLIILDETQDMTASRRDALRYMLTHDTSAAQLVVMGDPHQCIYDYDKDDPAQVKFLVDAPVEFAEHGGGRDWCSKSLTTSYRSTPHVARFINLFWKTSIVSGNTCSPNLPVEYWVCNHYGKELTERLRCLLEDEPQGEVVFLNLANLVNKESGVERPLKKQVNLLLDLKNDNGKRCFNFHTQQTESEKRCSTKNKVRAWTFASSKGCTFPVVVVFGFSVYNGKIPSMNQVCVALSRASRRLIVVHNTAKDPQPYLPPLTSRLLRDLVSEGVVECPHGIPHDQTMPEVTAPEESTLSVTGLTHLSATSIARLLGRGTRRVLAPEAEPLPYAQLLTFHTGEYSSEEDVSAMYGTAVMFAVEHACTGAIRNVESLLSPITLRSDARFTTDLFGAFVQNKLRVTLTALERVTLERKMKGDAQMLSGEELVCHIRNAPNDFPSLKGHGVRAYRARDDVFTGAYLHAVRAVYEKADKATEDYMYLANAALAFEGTHEVFVQVGQEGYHRWVDNEVFQVAVARIQSILGDGKEVDFEVPLEVNFETPIRGERRVITGIRGRVDVAREKTSLEIKFCSSLRDEHELQNLLYAAMNCTLHDMDSGTSTLFNSRTGEVILHSITKGDAWELLLEVARMKA